MSIAHVLFQFIKMKLFLSSRKTMNKIQEYKSYFVNRNNRKCCYILVLFNETTYVIGNYNVFKRVNISSFIQPLPNGIFQVSGPEDQAPRRGYKGKHMNP